MEGGNGKKEVFTKAEVFTKKAEVFTKAAKKREHEASPVESIVLLLLNKKLMVLEVKMVFKFLPSAWDNVEWEPIQPSLKLEGQPWLCSSMEPLPVDQMTRLSDCGRMESAPESIKVILVM